MNLQWFPQSRQPSSVWDCRPNNPVSAYLSNLTFYYTQILHFDKAGIVFFPTALVIPILVTLHLLIHMSEMPSLFSNP